MRWLFTTIAVTLAIGVALAQPYAYTANISGNSVSVVNTATNTVTTTISVPASPSGLAVTPNGAYVYVACQGANSVVVISTASNSIVSTIAVGTTPVQLAITPNGSQVYVVVRGQNQIAVIDVASNSVIGTIAVGNRPVAVAFNVNGSRAYVPNLYGENISIIDTSSKAVIGTFTAGSGPGAVTVTAANRIYVANQYSNNVTVHDISGNLLTSIPGFSLPNWLAATPNGARVFVSNGNSSSAGVIDTSSNTLMATVTTGSNPTSVAVSSDGVYAYVVNEYAFSLSQVSVATNVVLNTLARVGVYPVAVAIAPAGNQPPQCTYTLSATSASFNASGGTGSVNVTAGSGCTWTAASNVNWTGITGGASGSGNGTVSFSVSPNLGANGLSGTLTIAGQTYTIAEAGVACTSALSAASGSFGPGGGSGSVNVTAPAGCSWTAASTAGWINITGGASGSGNGTVTFSVNPNGSSSTLSGTLNIAGQTYTVSEAGLGCSYSLSASTVTLGAGAGSASVSIFTAAGCVWTATSDSSWLTIATGSTGTGNGAINYAVTPNSGTGARTGNLTMTGGLRLTVTQTGATCSYTINPASVNIGSSGGSGTLGITPSPASCPALGAASNVNWASIFVSANTASWSVTGNSSTQTRTGVFSIGGQSVPVTQSGSGATSTMSLSRSSLNFGIAGSLATGAQSINVTFAGLGNAWTASSNQGNITVSPGSGTGNGTFQVSAAAGSSGVITVSAPGATNPSLQVQVNINAVTAGAPVGSFDTPASGTSGIAGAIAVTGWALDNIEVTKVDIWRESIGSEPAGLMYIGDAVFVPGARPDVEAGSANTPLNYRSGWGYLLLTNFLPNNGGSAGLGNGTYRIHAIAHNKAGASLDFGAHTITADNAHAVKPFGAIDTPAQGGTVSGSAYVNFGWALTQNPNMIPIDASTITVMVDGLTAGHPAYNNFRSDIASLFPGYMNSGGAIGVFYLDTTKLANGVHTISWNVFDNAGHGDGIGSRYFNVFNGAPAGAEAPPEEPMQRAASAHARKNGHSVQIEELGHVELPVDAIGGYQMVNGERAPLPIGSSLERGVFYWQPGPGFIGHYDLFFPREDGTEAHVRVNIRAKTYTQ